MKTFNVKFCYGGEGEPYVRSYKVSSVMRAFEKCLREYPGSKLIEAWREGGFLDGYGITRYEPPSTVKVEAEPAPQVEQLGLDLSLPRTVRAQPGRRLKGAEHDGRSSQK
jgi:hypothetical protein